MSRRVLIVDDEPLKRVTLQIELSEHGYDVAKAPDADTARRLLEARPFDVVITDVRMPGRSGLDLLTQIRQDHPTIAVILMTAYGTIDSAVLAMKRGAYDYLTKPFTAQELLAKLERFFSGRPARTESDAVETFGGLVTRSPGVRRAFQQARGAAQHAAPLLIRGEPGAGRHALAQALHAASPRADHALLRTVCAGCAGPEFERVLSAPAHAGATWLLEAVEELGAELQLRLLRVLERPTGPGVGLRVVGLTGVDLAAAVAAGRFREELAAHFRTLAIVLPPLRDRLDDIPLLAQHFASQAGALTGGRACEFTAHALDELLRHPWPGNVRELKQVVERALTRLTLAPGAGDKPIQIRAEHILPLGPDAPSEFGAVELGETSGLGLTETVADIERRMILLALRQCGQNQARAAQRLGIPRTTLRDKMSKYNIPCG
jgi:DNA-binding NtrC family response regulator